jgi:hypothetical protein
LGGKTNEPIDNARICIQVPTKTFCYNATCREPSYIGVHFEVIKAKSIYLASFGIKWFGAMSHDTIGFLRAKLPYNFGG